MRDYRYFRLVSIDVYPEVTLVKNLLEGILLMSTPLSKIQMVFIGCLSVTALSSAFNVPSASASTQDYMNVRGVEYAQRIDKQDRFEYRNREEYFNGDDRENQFGDDNRDNRRRRRVCWRLRRSISYLSKIREELRNDGDYSRAREIGAEIREQRYKYRRYCEQ